MLNNNIVNIYNNDSSFIREACQDWFESKLSKFFGKEKLCGTHHFGIGMVWLFLRTSNNLIYYHFILIIDL